MEGDDHDEAYTAIEWGMGLSLEILTPQGPRHSPLPKAICAAPRMRGADALPGSKATSRSKGARRNLGDLVWPAVASAIPGRDRKPKRRSCRGTGEESDGSIVLEKSSNKAVRNGGGEGGGKGPGRRGEVDAEARPGHSAGFGVSQEAPIRGSKLNGLPKPRTSITLDFRQEPGAGKPHAGICGGGAG